MSQPLDLIVGSLHIPAASLGNYSQTYDWDRGLAFLRMINGSQTPNLLWSKIKTKLVADGVRPSGLFAIDPSTPVSVSCVAPIVLTAATAAALVTAYAAFFSSYSVSARSDSAAQYAAVVAGQLVQTTSGTTVTSATSYQVMFWPVFSGYLKVSENEQVSSNDYQWTLEVAQS